MRAPHIKGWIFVVLCLFFIAFGTGVVVDNVFRLPRKYAHLRERGVPATAAFAGWRGLGDDRAPWLTLVYEGHRRTWQYPNDSRQFVGLPTGASVAMLVDPRSWHVAYTARDVERNTNAGWRAPAFFGVAAVLLGVVMLITLARDRRRLKRLSYYAK